MSRRRLQAKWKNFFRMLDEDGDKVITVEDFGLKAQRIIQAYGLRDALSVRCTQILMRWWHLCQELIGAAKPQITETDFIDVISKLYLEDKTKLEKIMSDLSGYLFDLMDVNSDGLISADELNKMNQCLGMKNSSLNAAIFDAWDEDEDGEISRDEYMFGMVAYLISDDPENSFGFVFEYNEKNLANDLKAKK